jgi:copper(I)-binding protein
MLSTKSVSKPLAGGAGRGRPAWRGVHTRDKRFCTSTTWGCPAPGPAKRVLKLKVLAISFAVFSSAAQTKSPPPSLAVSGAWLRAAAPTQVTGGYAVLENRSDTPISVTAVRSTVAKTIELHTVIERDGMMRMQRVEKFTVPARGKVELTPGGYHLMLFDVTRALNAGDRVTLTFVLDGGRELDVTFEIRKRDE